MEKMKTFLHKLNLKQVSEEKNEGLVKEITEKEISQQIKQFKKGKTPGDDGYTNEFYKIFQKQLTS